MRATDHIAVPDGFTDKVRRISARVDKLSQDLPSEEFDARKAIIGAEFRALFRYHP